MPFNDLFASTESLQLDLPDAEVTYLSQFDLGEPAEQLFKHLLNTVDWREEHITLFGKRYLQPRQFAWHGEANASYQYSGLQLNPEPWTPTLNNIRHQLEQHCQCDFNSVLLNHYRGQRDSMGMHADDEPELGPQPVIASLSLGEQRNLVFKHRYKKQLKPVKVPLESGSLLVMRGNTQANWKHGLNKQSTACGARINLTFRNILSQKQRPGVS